MIFKIFSVRDCKADAFMQPFYQATVGLAIRAFETAVCDPKTEFFKHPEDFTLYEIGEYDDSKGEFKNVDRRSVSHATDFRKDIVDEKKKQQ